jgi:UDP-glucose 4-epimerase
MKILVTGGAGFIGSHVVDRCIEREHEVTIVDNLSTGKIQNVNKRAKFYEMDVQDPSLREVFSQGHFDVVSHHAAQIDVRISVNDPMRDARTNILGFLNLMENVRRFKVGKTVLISSGGVIYGETPGEPATEVSLKRPFSPYGVTKYASEQYLFYYCKVQGVKGATLRYSNVYGPRQDPFGEAGVVAIFSKNLLRREALTIYGDGRQERDYVFVKDVVQANLLLAESELSGPIDTVDDLAFNVGTGRPCSVNELASLMKQIASSPSDTVYAPPRAGELLRNYLTCDKLKARFGWEPKYSLQEGLTETYHWFSQQKI